MISKRRSQSNRLYCAVTLPCNVNNSDFTKGSTVVTRAMEITVISPGAGGGGWGVTVVARAMEITVISPGGRGGGTVASRAMGMIITLSEAVHL